MMALAAAALLTFEAPPDKATQPTVIAQQAPAGSRLTLHLLSGTKPGPEMFADTEWRNGRLVLTPRFPLSRGQRYRAILRSRSQLDLTIDYLVPKSNRLTRPKVLAIWPTPDELPANLLKFHIRFSEPMREGRDIFDKIQLIDAQGAAVYSPWRRLELWSRDATRLTLWIHPGRIKQGVNLRERFGPVLRPNAEYSLVLHRSIRSAAGASLATDFKHSFTTIAEDRKRPLPQDWTLTLPRVGTREPLAIRFDEPLDRALLDGYLEILNAQAEPVSVTMIPVIGDDRCTVVPEKPWKSGNHLLQVSDLLEDLAGNTRVRVFDTDLTKPSTIPGSPVLYFSPRAQ
jgi:hypothetical protein